MYIVIIVAIVSLLGTIIGSFLGVYKSSQLTNYRLKQLEEKVDKHNNVIERVYRLEGKVDNLEDVIK